MKWAFLFALVCSGAFAQRAPDPAKTPGAFCRPTDEEYVERRYRERIPYCNRFVPVSVAETIFRSYRIPEKKWADYTIDHLVPLSLGGSNARTNLWPEPKEVKKLRYNLENDLYLRIKSGSLTHATAVHRVKLAKFNPPPAE